MEAKKYQLIPIEKGYIVISDEEIKKGDYYQFGGKSILQHDGHPNTGNYPKVITGHGDHRYVVISNECDKDCSSGDSICQTDLCKNKEIKITNSNAEIYQMWQEAKWEKEAEEYESKGYFPFAAGTIETYIDAKQSMLSFEEAIQFGIYVYNYCLNRQMNPNSPIYSTQQLFLSFQNSLLPDQLTWEGTLTENGFTLTKIIL